MSDKQTAAMLDKKLDEKTAHTMFVCGLVMVIAVLIHDGDHIRQALNWGYHIPLAIWALNLTVYIFTLVGAIGGIFTPASFLGLHLFGSATGLWGVWNFSYFALMKGVEYQGNFYQGVDWLSWVLLFHMVPCCVPCAVIGFKHWRRLKKEAQLG